MEYISAAGILYDELDSSVLYQMYLITKIVFQSSSWQCARDTLSEIACSCNYLSTRARKHHGFAWQPVARIRACTGRRVTLKRARVVVVFSCSRFDHVFAVNRSVAWHQHLVSCKSWWRPLSYDDAAHNTAVTSLHRNRLRYQGHSQSFAV